MKRIFLIAILLICSLNLFSQADIIVEVSSKRLMDYVYFLASDSLKGRKFPNPGKEIAAKFIANEFNNIGLSPIGNEDTPFFQIIPVTKLNRGKTIIHNINNRFYASGYHYSFAASNPFSDSLSFTMLYSGKEIPKNFPNDTVINIFSKGKKIDETIETLIPLAQNSNTKAFAISTTGKKGKQFVWREFRASGYQYPFSLMPRSNPGNIEWLHTKLPKSDEQIKVFVFNDEFTKSLYGHNTKELNRLARRANRKGINKDSLITSLSFQSNFSIHTDTLFDKNVIGYLEGTSLKDEVIIICGHYDHVGVQPNGVCLGADDNASGTAGVLELARMCAQAKASGFEFKRTLVFVAFCAEESGLNGSKYYVNNPIFPLEKTAFVINMDMIGRSDTDPQKPGFVYAWPVKDNRRPMRKVLRSIDRQMDNLHIYNRKKFPQNIMWYFGSDHFPFVQKGVPALIVSTGTHDDYHKPADTPEKINYQNMANILKTLFVVITDVANEPDKFPLP